LFEFRNHFIEFSVINRHTIVLLQGGGYTNKKIGLSSSQHLL